MTILWAAGLQTLSAPTFAAPLAQEDPVSQCAEGVRLFLDGQYAEALPLLEAGFYGREMATFANPDDLGRCALALGLLRYNKGDRAGALEASAVALEVFQGSGNRWFEGMTLNNIGAVYHVMGRYNEALEAYQQALAIVREVGDRAGEGTMLNNIGLVYDSQGRYAEALDAFQQALVIRREVGNRAGEGATLNNIGLVYHNQGRYVKALETFQQALAIRREVDDRAGEGTTLNNIGGVYHAQGHYAEALEVYQQALAIRREVGDRAGEGATLNNIGGIHDDQGHYAEALEIYQQALAIVREVGDRAGEGATLNNLGTVYRAQGRYIEALEVYQQALAIMREVGDRAGEGTTLNNIGLVYDNQGRYTEALEIYQQALAIVREVGDRASEGATLNNVGAVYNNQGRYAEALEVYQQALAIRREVGDRAGEGVTLNNIGEVYDDQGRYAEALEVYQQALAIVREVGNRAGEGATLNNIGGVYRAQGRYAEALEVYQQALAIMREVGDRAGEGTTLNNIGGIYDDQGRYAEALEIYQQALAIRREVGDRAGEGTTLDNIGFAYQRQGEVDQALAHYEQAMDVFESMRAIAGSEAGRAGFIAQHANLYSRAVQLYHQQSQDEIAFHTCERGRARAFLDSLATGHVQLSDQAAADLLTREQDAYAARQAAQDALAHARAQQPSDAALVASLEEQLAAAKEEHAAALVAIEARGDQLAALVPGRSAVLELKEVQALLDDQTMLVSYHVLGDDGTLAFIITRDSATVVELPEATPDNLLTALADQYQWLNLENPHPLPLRNLHAWLVAPLAEYLHTPLVGIIPHQLLHYVPFAALTDGETYFGQQYTLFTLPSASALPLIRESGRQTVVVGQELAVIVGNPTTGDYDAVASLAMERNSLSNLPFAEEEARAIADLYGVEPLLGQDATESTVRAQSPQADILHLAAHGKFNPVAPLSSLIALAPDDEYDGWLTVGEVYGLDLNQTDLVVLSACETQLGDLSAGDELVGLTRAFFFAGTPTVVASLWPVDDAATQELMVAFYKHWQSGMGKAEALQAAQAEVREKYPSPYYWAGFVLSGDPGGGRPLPSPLVRSTLTETSQSAEDEGGGICPLAAILPLLLLSLWSARRRWEVQ